jgi:hypothetical protein
MTAPAETTDKPDTATESAERLAETVTAPSEKPAPATDDKSEGEGKADPGKSAEPGPLLKADGKPFGQSDLDALNTALKAARADAKAATSQLAAVKAAGGDRDPAEVVAETTASVEGVWKPRLVKSAARAALTAAGLALPEGREAEVMARAIRLLDEDALTITDDGDVEGLAEQVESLRTDFPDLFVASRRASRAVRPADRPGTPAPPKSTAELLAAQHINGR